MESFDVTIAKDGEEVLEYTYTNKFDIYLFDINVPKINGLDILRLLRQTQDDTPCIYLTSYTQKDMLKEGFRSGADDYMVKPFDEDELILRINALLKRINKISEIVTINGVEFNPNIKVFSKNKNPINAAKKVVDLFCLFYENKNTIITKEMIINKLWTASEDYSEGSIRVYISKLKDILGNEVIQNIKGQGYKIQF